jgi:hypothetical protein
MRLLCSVWCLLWGALRRSGSCVQVQTIEHHYPSEASMTPGGTALNGAVQLAVHVPLKYAGDVRWPERALASQRDTVECVDHLRRV